MSNGEHIEGYKLNEFEQVKTYDEHTAIVPIIKRLDPQGVDIARGIDDRISERIAGILNKGLTAMGMGTPLRNAPSVPGAIYKGLTHQQLYDMIHEDSASPVVMEIGDSWISEGIY